MQQRHADLRIVDEVVGVLLPNAKPEIAGTERDMTAEFELRIAFGLEVELRVVGCSGKLSNCAASGLTFSSENGSKNRPM